MVLTPRGFLISIEGVEGSGKSTQAGLLRTGLERKGVPVLLTREPGGTETGRDLRRLLLNGRDIEPLTELLLFLADRHQHWREVIQPALADDKLVIVDRFMDSTVAYQGYGRGLPLDKIDHLNYWALDGVEPDLTVLLDLPFEEGLQRLKGDKDKIESEGEAFHLRIRLGYLTEAGKYPERIVKFDATSSPNDLAQTILETVWDRYETPVKPR